MPPTIAPFRAYQWGREATKGTAVAATSKMAVEMFDPEPEDLVVRPRIANGLAVGNPGNELVTRRSTLWRAGGPVVYDQLQNWLEMAVVGNQTPTGTGPYVWTYTRNPLADPALKSFTLERRRSDGASPVDEEWAYALARTLRISGADGEPLRFEVEGFARRVQSSTLTAAQALPTIEDPPIALTKVWIDTAWAGLGTTQIVAQVLSYSWMFNTGAKPIWTADGRTDLDFTVDVIDGREVNTELEIVCMVAGQMATEKTAAEAQSLRAVRIQADGSSSKQVQIDGLYKHAQGSLFKLGEQDGMDIVSLRLVGASDLTNFARVKVTNAVATLI